MGLMLFLRLFKKGVQMENISRRSFMKKAAVMGVFLSSGPVVFVPKARASWAKKTLIHPQVDNLRVVGITDPFMAKSVETKCDWIRQEELVVPGVVWENMDKMACRLVDTRNVEQAWRTIFVKPPRKLWSEAVVAVKTNHIAQQHTHSAIMSKVCHVLTDVIGVKPSNIHIYDGCHGRDITEDTPFKGLPEGTRIENRWGGINTFTVVPRPWRDGESKSKCLKHLVNGSVNILINISMCKGHSLGYGGFTMTMKNHFGTFSPSPGHREQSLEYLLALNQTQEILGAMDEKTGTVLYPRQQLCIVDALWASNRGPGGNPSHQPNFLAMGVMSPVVDYLMATRFRKGKMGWEINMDATNRFLSEFGYKEADLPNGGNIIEV
jgi:Domain of unknown function (DUF362)